MCTSVVAPRGLRPSLSSQLLLLALQFPIRKLVLPVDGLGLALDVISSRIVIRMLLSSARHA